jgi:hypothetical protein
MSESTWENFKRNILEGIHSSVGHAERLTKIGKLKLELNNQRKELLQILQDLGIRTYELMSHNLTETLDQDREILQLKERADEITRRITRLRQDVENLSGNTKTGAGSDDYHQEFI